MRTGATALCRWLDTEEEREYYFSFGHYNEATGTDGLGISDDNVFFYCSEGELVAMVGGNSNDFQVLEILSYTEKEEG